MPVNDNNENQELLNLIGDDAFTRLCTVFGGTRLHVSNSERSRKRLTIFVGEENAGKMIFHFDGVALTLPMLSSLEIKKTASSHYRRRQERHEPAGYCHEIRPDRPAGKTNYF